MGEIERPFERSPGQGDVDVLGPLGPVHDVDPGDGRVNRGVQRNIELSVGDPDVEWGPLGVESFNLFWS